MKILIIDNHDSFVYNIVGLLTSCGVERSYIDVIMSDQIHPHALRNYNAVILSPGPGLPHESGRLMQCVEVCALLGIPVLGICLGMQAIALHYGGSLFNRQHPCHGHPSSLSFTDTPDPLLSHISGIPLIGRYHSWQLRAETLRMPLLITSYAADDGAVMSIRHSSLPMFGLQFHPESIITAAGRTIMQNFLSIATGHPIVIPL